MSHVVTTESVSTVSGGVSWEGCLKSSKGCHAPTSEDWVYPFEGFLCRHCGVMVWWNFDSVKGGY